MGSKEWECIYILYKKGYRVIKWGCLRGLIARLIFLREVCLIFEWGVGSFLRGVILIDKG